MPHVLTLNGGSSSIRFSVCDGMDASKLVSGKIERMGTADASLTVDDLRDDRKKQTKTAVDAGDHRSAGAFLLDWLASQSLFDSIGAVGHRVVHGMQHSNPERITPELVSELKTIKPYDPEHLPSEIELIELVGRRLPKVPQVACFDTAFHRSMPRQATLLAIPRRYFAKGVQRYGFHGLSYTYLMEELGRLGDAAATRGRVILAHLGNGASVAAVLDGKSVDTSMGFTPTAGLVMSSRSGDLDPGLVSFLAATESMDAAGFERMVTHEIDAYWRAANYLSVGQIYLCDNPLLKRAAGARGCEAHAAGTLGHDARAEFHLRAPEPGHQKIRPRHDLRLRARARRTRPSWQYLSRGHLQRDLSRTSARMRPGFERSFSVFVSRRNSQPRLAGVSGLDPRGRRTGLFAEPFVRRGVRQSRSRRRLRRRRRRGGDRTAGHRVAFQQVSRSGTDGAVLPILHLNGYKISNPTILARITREELEQLLRGYGWTPYFVEGHEPESCMRPWPRRSTWR
jgi:hypothetical protein